MRKLRKQDIKPGDELRNTQSNNLGIAMASEKDPTKLHERAREDYVRVAVDTKKGIRQTPWSIENVERANKK